MKAETGQHRAEAKARILEVARRLFTARGYDVVTVREIAAAAEVSVTLAYIIFSDKVNIWRSAMGEPPPNPAAITRQAEKAFRREARREELLEAARTIFQRDGYRKASLHTVAAAVGLGHRSVYDLFADKPGLWREAMESEPPFTSAQDAVRQMTGLLERFMAVGDDAAEIARIRADTAAVLKRGVDLP